MRRPARLVVVIAVLVVVTVAAGTAALWRPHDLTGHSFTVGGQTVECTSTGTVALDAALFYPGPTAGFVLDGVPLEAEHPGGDAYELRPVRPVQFPCGDGEQHRIVLESGHPDAVYTGCQIRLISPLVPIDGKDIRPVPSYAADENTCDLTWTD